MTPRTLQAARRFRAVVERVVEETPDVRTLRLAMPAGETIEFQPGQHIRVKTAGSARDYSFASAPGRASSFEITVARGGAFTERLFALKPGDALDAEGPRGDWHFEPAGPLILVCGGTGLAPMRSIIYAELGAGQGPVHLYYCAKTPADIVYREELEAFRRKGVRVHVTVSRPELLKGEAWAGPRGRITLETIEADGAPIADAVFYLCGPGALVSGIRDALRTRGVPKDRIRCEAWGR